MDFINNDPKEIRKRRSQNTLIVVGTGIILFGIWTAVKLLGSFFMLKKETVAALRMIGGDGIAELSDTAVFYVALFVVMVIMLVILAVRTYVGLSAIDEGRGKKRHRFYLPVAIIMIIGGIASFFTNFFSVNENLSYGALSPDTTISGLIIELTSVIMLIEMVVSAVRIRKLNGPGKRNGGR